MVLGRLRYEIEAEDNTGPAIDRFSSAMSGAFDEVADAAAEVGPALEESLDDAADDAEGGPLGKLREGLERMAERGGLALTAALGAAVSAALQGLNEAFEFLEERRNALEVALFTPTAAEEGLHTRVTAAGFDPQEAAAGILATRAFDVDPAGQQASNLALTTAALSRAGVNTRFLPQVASRFGVLDDPSHLVAQLGVGADVVSQTGVDFEEVFSEIADNPQVYGAFPTFAHAAQFIVSQGLAPPEVTIQLEQGRLAPTGGAVTGDPYTLTGITPTAGERFEQRQGGLVRGITGALGAIPIIGGELQELTTSAATTAERLFGPELDRTGRTQLTLRGEPGDVIVDGMAVVAQALAENTEAVRESTLRTSVGVAPSPFSSVFDSYRQSRQITEGFRSSARPPGS